MAGKFLGIGGDSAKAFEVIIQGGALLAVLGLYHGRIREMWEGMVQGNIQGRRLALNLLIGFLPAAIAGLLLHHVIKENLFTTSAVASALVMGGVIMIAVDRWNHHRLNPLGRERSLSAMSFWEAFLIGLAQLFALWPGTSRSMVTLVAGLLLGFPPAVAAEYSFLLALPTLGAAAGFDLLKNGASLFHDITFFSFFVGFFTAAFVSVITIPTFISYLSRGRLAPFGWYRILLAFLIWKYHV